MQQPWQQQINPQQMGPTGMDPAMGGMGLDDAGMGSMSSAPLSYNQKSSERMRQDEGKLSLPFQSIIFP